ncbi:MAG TPA: hypothetical protein VNI57_00690, partial [Candidatus Saccharimonadales bacterium]|nr:hypothetical protein [Candidatus Saccharimonadales bacterium]
IAWRESPDAPARPAKRAILVPGRWLVVADGATGKVDAFDLSRDPGALDDLGADPPAPARALIAAMQLQDEAMLRQGGHAAPAALDGRPIEEQLDEKTLERLRSLGYLD